MPLEKHPTKVVLLFGNLGPRLIITNILLTLLLLLLIIIGVRATIRVRLRSLLSEKLIVLARILLLMIITSLTARRILRILGLGGGGALLWNARLTNLLLLRLIRALLTLQIAIPSLVYLKVAHRMDNVIMKLTNRHANSRALTPVLPDPPTLTPSTHPPLTENYCKHIYPPPPIILKTN